MSSSLKTPGFASGWFVACFSDQLAPGEARPVRFFGQDLVLFRSESGEPVMLDAHCPHMGAHLGHGGKVRGDRVVCPFHAWEFGPTGDCVEIPYADKIPKKAKVACWPLVEKNGFVFVWYDRAKDPPSWQIPDMPEFGAPGWTAWSHGELEVKTHPREIVENVVDVGHFMPVHGTDVSTIENVFDAHKATQINSGTAYPIGGGHDHYSLEATYHGPAWQLTDWKGFLQARLVNCHTPIDEDRLLLRFGVLIQETDDVAKTELIAQKYVENMREGFFQDIAIWENLSFRERPILCAGDGPLMKLRQWYQEFYQPDSERVAALEARRA
ncbi:MAG: aromatic ring-hydroxylating dioxygenase subunit alpha [Proteobacteria bacterium]|nr:aromatic ring-hydroxylating dioxygenase subunit alpha [Pseudomonadota bacterium]MCP4922066.1 aromatic ring-hydroxylating dioxygenase subunit alpha [Pseudomonadota bacterium]